MQYWWDVTVGFVTEEDIKASICVEMVCLTIAQKCDPEEHALIDRLIERKTTAIGVLDKATVEREEHPAR